MGFSLVFPPLPDRGQNTDFRQMCAPPHPKAPLQPFLATPHLKGRTWMPCNETVICQQLVGGRYCRRSSRRHTGLNLLSVPPMKRNSISLGVILALAFSLTLDASAQITPGLKPKWEFNPDDGVGVNGVTTVAMDGDLAVVGDSFHRSAKRAALGRGIYNDRVGAAVVLQKQAGKWVQTDFLLPSDADTTAAGFGSAVAISGNTIAVYGAQSDSASLIGTWTRPTVYLFVRTGNSWVEQTKFEVADVGNVFPNQNSISLHGDQLAVGLPGEGRVKIWARSGSVWSLAGVVPQPAGASALFGNSTRLSGDRLFVGDWGDGKPAVYVFTGSGLNWNQEARLEGTPSVLAERFGAQLAIEGDTLLVGAPLGSAYAPGTGSAYVFVRDGSTWTRQAVLQPSGPAMPYAGGTIALSGSVAFLGDSGPYAKESPVPGWSFTRSGTTWTGAPLPTLTPLYPTPPAYYLSVSSAAMSGGSLLMAVGDLLTSQFNGVSSTFGNVEFARLRHSEQDYGSASAVSSGGTVFVGAATDTDENVVSTGSVYVLAKRNNDWALQTKLYPGSAAVGSRFGAALAADGDTLLVGAPDAAHNQGAAYVFVRTGNEWTRDAKLQATLRPPSGMIDPHFGQKVAVSGTRALILTSLNVVVFTREGSSWARTAILPLPDGVLGKSIAIAGDNAWVGAPDDAGGGAVYEFHFAGSTWKQVRRMAGPNSSSTQFGAALAYDRSQLAVASKAIIDRYGSWYPQVSLFTRSGLGWKAPTIATSGDFALRDGGLISMALAEGQLSVIYYQGDRASVDTTYVASFSWIKTRLQSIGTTYGKSVTIIAGGEWVVSNSKSHGSTVGYQAISNINVVTPTLNPDERFVVGSHVRRKFVIQNLGFGTLTGIKVTASNGVTVTQPASPTLAAGEEEPFTVDLVVNLVGPLNFSIDVASDDPYHPVFHVAQSVTGTGLPEPPSPILITPYLTPANSAPSTTFWVGTGTNPGEKHWFVASFKGTAPLTLQWYRNGKALRGQTADTLTFPEVTDAKPGEYTLRVTNAYGTSVSEPIHALSWTPVADRSLRVIEGRSFSLACSVQGNADFSWTLNGHPLADDERHSGTQTRRLTVKNVALTDGGDYIPMANGQGLQTTSVTVVPNQRPQITELQALLLLDGLTWEVGGEATGGPFFTSVDTVKHFASGLPPGVKIDPITGTFVGRPQRAGTYHAKFTAINDAGRSEILAFDIVVTPVPEESVGTHVGLVERSPLNDGLGGSIRITVTREARITGVVVMGTKRYSFTGRFGANFATASLGDSPHGPLSIDYVGGMAIEGSIYAGSEWVRYRTTHAIDKLPAGPFEQSRFNLTLQSDGADPASPEGAGFASVNVTRSGMVLAGKLADGTAIAASNPLLAPTYGLGNVPFPVYLPLYSGTGSATGWFGLNFVEGAGGELTWNKSSVHRPTGTYPDGFPLTTLSVGGGRYTAPASGETFAGITAGWLEFGGAALNNNPISTTLTIGSKGKVLIDPTDRHQISLTVRSATGLFEGAFNYTVASPYTGQPITRRAVFEGLVNPNTSEQYGYFVLPPIPVPAGQQPSEPALPLSGLVLLRPAS